MAARAGMELRPKCVFWALLLLVTAPHADNAAVTLARSVFQGLSKFEPSAPHVIDSPEDYLGPGDRAVPFSIKLNDGPLMGREQHQLRPYSGPLGEGLHEYLLNANESQVLGFDARADLVVFGAIDRKEGVMTRFTPPKPLLIQGAPGTRRHETVSVEVIDLLRPEKRLHEGRLEVDVVYRGALMIDLSGEQPLAVLMDSTAVGKIGPATIEDRQYRLYAEDLGLIASRELQKVTAFALYRRSIDELRLLITDSPS